MYLPFARAQYGPKPEGGPESWVQADGGQPLGEGQSLKAAANHVMNINNQSYGGQAAGAA